MVLPRRGRFVFDGDPRITNEGESRMIDQHDVEVDSGLDHDNTLMVQGLHCQHYYRVPKQQVLNHLFDACPKCPPPTGGTV